MLDWLDALHAVLRAVHIGLGFVGLLLFWVVIGLRKGGPTHRRCGRWFVRCAYVVGGTGVVSSLWALADVESFAPLVRAASDAARQEALREMFRFLFAILLFLSVATVAGAVLGVELIRQRDVAAARRRPHVVFWQLFTVATSLGLIALGVHGLLTDTASVPGTSATRYGLPWVAYWVPVGVGLFGAGAALRELIGTSHRGGDPRDWLFKHVQQLCGTGVAFHTAFIVFGAGRLFGFQWSGPWALVPWVAPPVIGMVLTAWYVRRLRRSSRFVA
ncbi:MAG: hypothetical protein U0935_04860 [Pirellulales bacterium]